MINTELDRFNCTAFVISKGTRTKVLFALFSSNYFWEIKIGPGIGIWCNIQFYTPRIWLFIAYSDERWSYSNNSHYLHIRFLLKGWGNVMYFLNLGVKGLMEECMRLEESNECISQSPRSFFYGQLRIANGKVLLPTKPRSRRKT